MSLFDYPRVNFRGTLRLNPGTANNDDYAQEPSTTMPGHWGPFAGQALGLIDSIQVKARTYGLSDEAFVEWVQKTHHFVGSKGESVPLVPAEWNYYGVMDSKIEKAEVIGVQTDAHHVYTEVDPTVPLTAALGADLTYSGGFTDINSEGSPPATQFFIQTLDVSKDGQKLISGPTNSCATNKGTCQWINFFRNVNLTADGGAGGYVYHVMEKAQGATIDLPGFDGDDVVGVVFRYYLFRALIGTQDNAGLEAIYAEKGLNPALLEIVGTFAPLYAGETIKTAPTGRLMISNEAKLETPTTNNNGGGHVALAPAIVQVNEGIVSVDFIGTFPDNWQPAADGSSHGTNLKWNFGDVTLLVTDGSQTAAIGQVDYQETHPGNQRGWLFDFDVSGNRKVLSILAGGEARFFLQSGELRPVLMETEFMVVTNQQAVYAEQHLPGDRFLNQGTHEPMTVSVYRQGVELDATTCPPMTIWQYQANPIQAPGDAVTIDDNFLPGQPITVDTAEPGNLLLTFSFNPTGTPPAGYPQKDHYPPTNYNTFMGPPWVTNAPQISIRILPNEDFRRYYVDPRAKEPVGNELLTWNVVYDKVLRTYYLLFPGMNEKLPLNDEQKVTAAAPTILQVTDMSRWMTTRFMPRTRDMSWSRRRLLRAWCRKVIGQAR